MTFVICGEGQPYLSIERPQTIRSRTWIPDCYVSTRTRLVPVKLGAQLQDEDPTRLHRCIQRSIGSAEIP